MPVVVPELEGEQSFNLMEATTKQDHSSRDGFFPELRISPDPKVQMAPGEIISPGRPQGAAVPQGRAQRGIDREENEEQEN